MRNIFIGLLLAAPFVSTTTSRADLAHVDTVHVYKLPDGGVAYRPKLTLPVEITLPDAGVVTKNTILDTNTACELAGTARTQVLSFMNNAGLSCALSGHDLGN